MSNLHDLLIDISLIVFRQKCELFADYPIIILVIFQCRQMISWVALRDLAEFLYVLFELKIYCTAYYLMFYISKSTFIIYNNVRDSQISPERGEREAGRELKEDVWILVWRFSLSPSVR